MSFLTCLPSFTCGIIALRMARLGRFFPCMSICLVIFVAEQYIGAHARKTKTTGSEHFSAGDETYRQDFAAIWNRLPGIRRSR